MKNWEDIFRESLEDCTDRLPDGSLEEFQRKLSSPRGRHTLAWIAVPAAAACAALALLLPHHDGGVSVKNVVAEVKEAVEPVPVSPDCVSAPQEDSREPGSQITVPVRKLIAQAPEVTEKSAPAGTVTLEAPFTNAQPGGNTYDDEPDSKETAAAGEGCEDRGISPMAPQDKGVTWVALDKASTRRRGTGVALKAGGGLLGGVGAGLLACVASGTMHGDDIELLADMGPSPRPGVHLSSANSELRRHDWIPFKAGVTARYPLAERLYLMSGLEYSIYGSEVERFLTGKKRQYAHYLSVPLRLDWSVVKKNSFELYMGAGASADFCVAARYAGRSVHKDVLGVSLTAAGGAMWKISSHAGIYLEPQLSWCPGSSSAMPRTYRTNHTLVPCVATGVRFTICEK